ncbi:MAG: hypothetical protein LBG59_07990 [Candidatus Peribacteria bacterium]|nr:hypothetical protein [Candidatus Peribacteria bacterium]
MLLPVAQNLKNGRCMVYSRTSSDDIKKDIKDNLILDNEKYANNEAWHAACCGLNVENKNLREYGSYFGKYYNEFEFNLEKFVKMIYNKNLRGSFYFLIQP